MQGHVDLTAFNRLFYSGPGAAPRPSPSPEVGHSDVASRPCRAHKSTAAKYCALDGKSQHGRLRYEFHGLPFQSQTQTRYMKQEPPVHGRTNSALSALIETGAAFEVIHLAESVHTVADVATVCGCAPRQVLKTLVLLGKAAVIAVIPGDSRLDIARIRSLVGDSSIKFAREQEAISITGYAVGSISPYGIDNRIAVFVDSNVPVDRFVLVGSGHPDKLIKMEGMAFVSTFKGSSQDVSL